LLEYLVLRHAVRLATLLEALLIVRLPEMDLVYVILDMMEPIVIHAKKDITGLIVNIVV